MSKFKLASIGGGLAVMTGAALPWAAHAATGPYIGLEGGLNLLDNQTIRDSATGNDYAKIEFKNGWMAGGVAGFSFANGLRPELEYSYRRNSLQRFEMPAGGILSPAVDTTNVKGHQSADTAMFNVWYDLKWFAPFRPYLGAGIGASRVSINNFNVDGTALRSDNNWVLAWQAGAGVAFDFNEHFSTSIDYRFLRTAFDDYAVGSAGAEYRTNYQSNSIMLGMQYHFGKKEAPPPPPAPEPVAVVPPAEPPAPPPPPPPPPPCEVQPGAAHVDFSGCKAGDTVLLRGVNFEFDKAKLTLNAKTLLDPVADALVARPDITVEIDGYTDSKGSDAYNLKLSDARSKSVMDYLAAHGVDASRMTTKGYGEADPIGDNSTDEGREQNRRVQLKVTAADDPGSVSVAPPAGTEAPPAPAEPAAPAAPEAPAAPSSDSATTPDVPPGTEVETLPEPSPSNSN
ncbi:OmpA family protein [Solimonas marina]|uniref:OmpA family protein n=1 Tax=Solimonas marina TaxID=2714601 RepID=A0A969W6Q4_9GAMM|nr:OmpA family protein [Solimonas marina]NKF20953.1 OmpA family protein [Solimonas marina]